LISHGKKTGQAQAWLKEKHHIEFGTNSVYYQLGKLGERSRVAYPSRLKSVEKAASAFKVTLAKKMRASWRLTVFADSYNPFP
jgi:hypothetical protein